MKFFLDTANIDEIRDAASTGILDGITTNPTLISKEGNTFEDQLLKICSLVNGPVSAETVSRDAAGMVEEGRHLAKLHPNIVVKCPMTKEGLKATKDSERRADSRECDAGVLRAAGNHGRKSRRIFRQPVCRPARRHRRERHGV